MVLRDYVRAVELRLDLARFRRGKHRVWKRIDQLELGKLLGLELRRLVFKPSHVDRFGCRRVHLYADSLVDRFRVDRLRVVAPHVAVLHCIVPQVRCLCAHNTINIERTSASPGTKRPPRGR